MCVLDGLHRLPPEVLAVLQRLLVDGECELHDGRRILPASHHDVEYDSSDILRIHPSFRVIGLAEPPTKKAPWLQASTLEQFSFVELPRLPATEASFILASVFPDLRGEVIKSIVEFSNALVVQPGVAQLTLRQMVRICRQIQADSEQKSLGNEKSKLIQLLRNTLLVDFQPSSHQDMIADTLQSALAQFEGKDSRFLFEQESDVGATPPSVDQGVLRIGLERALVDLNPARPELVPHPRFHDNPRHSKVMEGLLRDHASEKGILLIGNQGVGKNKIADRLLELLGREREYIQLHRYQCGCPALQVMQSSLLLIRIFVLI